jgi:hypothetical protein
MTKPDKKSDQQQVWKSLSEAGLVEIPPHDFPQRIKDVKHAVMVRLGELFALKTDYRERESAAQSLGTLKQLETTVQANASKPTDPGA